MNKVYDMDELYSFSDEWKPEFDGFCLTIDNFYNNADTLHDHIMNRDFPLWKYNAERDSQNTIDYYDCRINDNVSHPTRKYFADMDRLLHFCRKYYWAGHYTWSNFYEFNLFKSITIDDKKIQHYPHTDEELTTPDNRSTLNMIVYLDKNDDGGTAVYNGEWITNDERFNLMYPVEERFTVDRIIPAKFNRCVIFPGNRIHGAWVDDYSKVKDSWRCSQVRFLHPRF